MSSLIKFPVGGADHALVRSSGRRHVTAAVFDTPSSHTHAVQFYEDDGFLFDTVGHFLASGLQAGERVVAIATGDHRAGLTQRLHGAGFTDAVESGQLVVLDARESLSKFMIGDMPNADLFRDWIGRVMTGMQTGARPVARVRAYGEMVDVLWREGNSRAAVRLEELWNDAGKEHAFSLLCAYVMGNFYKEGDQAKFFEVCRNHSHVIPTERFSELDDPNARLREISLLQQRARALETEIQHRAALESALRDALAERSRAEEELRACIEREKDARAKAEASDAFKEMFLGILGHDLRNPLNTVLTTARLMTMRGELPPESKKRLERVVSSGVRMERMIGQLLDLTSARIAGGISVTRNNQDLVPLVSKIVDEVRLASPERTIDVEVDGPCEACVDGDRFEQVASNLLGNAVRHGDPEKPIHVAVVPRGRVASLRVHNYGAPIDPAFMPLLFDPFKRGEKSQGRSDGLGLGLYITERIVNAHGGRIEVESSVETGTCFEAVFPKDG
jgi:signal transduction histidine kinase